MDFSWEMLEQVLPFGEMGHQISQCSAMHVARDGERRVRWQTTLQYIARMTLMMMNLELASWSRQHQTSSHRRKKASHIIMENVLFSGQNFRKMGDADTSNRSSLGSAISYSESCAPYGDVDASEMSGQSSQCLLCCCLTKWIMCLSYFVCECDWIQFRLVIGRNVGSTLLGALSMKFLLDWG